MSSKGSFEYLPWFIAGVAFLAVLSIFAWNAHGGGNTADRLASKATRIDLVERMQLELASASEAEKSAVLAVTDADSVAFADQARTTTGEVPRKEQELGALLTTGGTPRERDLLAQFSLGFEHLQRVEDEVLSLAVKNTNIKAYALLFGPAADTLAEMDASLDRVVRRYAESTDGERVMDMAFRVRIGVLRIQVLLAPHIAEESDAKMDQMEARMTAEEGEIRRHLDGLTTSTMLTGDADLAAAAGRFTHYEEIKARIVPLSRENTNVRSLALSLNQHRKAMGACLDALNELGQTMLDEPTANVTYGRRVKPR